jgi:hypothetical protein
MVFSIHNRGLVGHVEEIASKQLLDKILTLQEKASSICGISMPQRGCHATGFEIYYDHLVSLSSPDSYKATALVL